MDLSGCLVNLDVYAIAGIYRMRAELSAKEINQDKAEGSRPNCSIHYSIEWGPVFLGEVFSIEHLHAFVEIDCGANWPQPARRPV